MLTIGSPHRPIWAKISANSGLTGGLKLKPNMASTMTL